MTELDQRGAVHGVFWTAITQDEDLEPERLSTC